MSAAGAGTINLREVGQVGSALICSPPPPSPPPLPPPPPSPPSPPPPLLLLPSFIFFLPPSCGQVLATSSGVKGRLYRRG